MPGATQAQLGGLPFVAVVQAADFGSHHDAADRLDGAFRRSILAQREVRPRPLVGTPRTREGASILKSNEGVSCPASLLIGEHPRPSRLSKLVKSLAVQTSPG